MRLLHLQHLLRAIVSNSLPAICVALLIPGNARADDAPKKQVDQLFVLDADPVITNYPKFLPEGPDTSAPLTQAQVRIVIECALAAQQRKAVDGPAPKLDVCTADTTAQPANGQNPATAAIPDPVKLDNSTYYILHLVHHIGGKVGNIRDSWYVYFHGWVGPSPINRVNDLRLSRHYKEARLYGAKRLTLVYFHYGVPAGPVGDTTAISKSILDTWVKTPSPSAGDPDLTMDSQHQSLAQLQRNIDFLAHIKGYAAGANFSASLDTCNQSTGDQAKDLANCRGAFAQALVGTTEQQAFQAGAQAYVDRQFQLVHDGAVPDSGTTLVMKDATTLSGSLRSFATGDKYLNIPDGFLPIVYTVEVAKKTPDYIQNLQAVLGQFGFTSALSTLQVQTNTVAISSVKDGMQIQYVPSDITVTGNRGPQDKQVTIGKSVFDNESKYWFDFSFAMPLKNPKELKIDGTFPNITGQPIEKTRIYGIVDVFPGPVDTKKLFWRLTPQLLYGMPLTSKPWESHLFAVGIGTSFVQPFLGWTYSKLQTTTPTPSSTGLDWKWHFVWGLNIQAKDIAKVIKSTATGGK